MIIGLPCLGSKICVFQGSFAGMILQTPYEIRISDHGNRITMFYIFPGNLRYNSEPISNKNWRISDNDSEFLFLSR